jgi:hypothetical protein
VTTKTDKGEGWRYIGDNVPRVEIYGPYSNQYRLFVQDIDGDMIGLLPADAKRLIVRLQKGLDIISNLRKEARAKRKPKA